MKCHQILIETELMIGLQGAAAAMFPFENENDDLHWDEYGAALQPDEFQLKSTSRPGQFSCLQATFQLSFCLSLILSSAFLSRSLSLSVSACSCQRLCCKDYLTRPLQRLVEAVWCIYVCCQHKVYEAAEIKQGLQLGPPYSAQQSQQAGHSERCIASDTNLPANSLMFSFFLGEKAICYICKTHM